MIKVSIIVPVYNVEEYLDKCLNSLINQTLKEIEIIVVNDGATDGSQKIIDKYSQQSSKIKAYIKKNGGLSDARNYGLKHCQGEYIGYVDSDDYVELNMFELLYNKAKQDNSEIVECNLHHTYPNSEDIEIGREIHDPKEMIMFGRSVVWNKIYQREWLQNTQVEFAKGLIYEDVQFFIMLVPHIRQYAYIDEALIHYVQRGNSLNNRSSKKTLDILHVLENIKTYYIENNFYSEYEESLEFLFARIILCSSFSRMCRIPDKTMRKDALLTNWEYLINHFPHWRKNKRLKGKTNKQILYMRFVNKLTYPLFCLIFPLYFHMKQKKVDNL